MNLRTAEPLCCSLLLGLAAATSPVHAANACGPNALLSGHTNSGGVIESHLFYASGFELTLPVSAGDPFAFGSQWGYTTDQATSSDTGMLLCTWRYYDPLTGRFLTRDPIGYAGGLNLYEFAGNNPVSYADPSGTNPIICGAIGAGIGAIFNGTVAYVHHQNVLRAVVRGATIGGVTGFFTCLGMPELGAGFLAGAASGAVGGAAGDSAGQLTAIAFGWQDCFNWPELLSSAAFGGAAGGLTNALGGAGGAVPERSGLPLPLPDPGEGLGSFVSRTLPKAAIRDRVRAAFNDPALLENLTTDERTLAAHVYEQAAKLTVGSRAEWASLYNLERAKYLRGEVGRLARTLPDFIRERGGQP